MKKLLLFTLLFVSAQSVFSQDKSKSESKQRTKIIIENAGSSEDKSLINEDHNIQIENAIEDFPHFSKECHNANLEDGGNRAMLGVRVRNASGNNGASITDIIEGSGAQKAGLMEGDLILKVGKKKVTNSDELIEALSQKEPNDRVKLKILRNGETIVKEVELSKPATKQCKVNCIGVGQNKEKAELEELKASELEQERKAMNEKETIIIKEKSEESTQKRNRSFSVNYLSGNPNPNSGLMSIVYKGDKEPFTIRVVDLNGKELFKDAVEDNSGVYKKEIEVERAAGTVLIQVKQGKNTNTAKIIIQ
ncbi:MAG: PDZ domain-containing protein [Saprospiraceae bacterium]